MNTFKRVTLLILLFSILSAAVTSPVHAIDRKVMLMFKTAGYGIAGGALVGAATWTMGAGTSKNILIGGSLGLYAGIILGGYILLTQENDKSRAPRNPWAPGRPVGPEDWKNEQDEFDLHGLNIEESMRLDVQLASQSFSSAFNGVSMQSINIGPQSEIRFWSPVFTLVIE